MRQLFLCLFLMLIVSHTSAGTLGKTHRYEKAKLPKSITADMADVIVVVESVTPSDVMTISTTSSNPDIRVRAVEMEKKVLIIITGDKVGKSDVSWSYKTTGGMDGGYKGLQIIIQ